MANPETFNRSRVSNNSATFLDGTHGRRTRQGRRWHDIHAVLASAAGGLDVLDDLAILDLRRATSLALLCEIAEQDLASGKSVDADAYIRLTSTLGRVLRRLGLGDDGDDLWNPARDGRSVASTKIFSARTRSGNGSATHG